MELVAKYADMLQVGTRNMQNFPLLQAVGAAGKPVMLKRGMSATIEEWLMAAEYIAQRGNLDIVLCERGIRTFETATRNTLDISAVPVAQRLSHLPVIVDPSHSGGRRDLVLPLSRAAIAVGADGIIVDVHPHPETALCDGPQALIESDLRELASVAQPPVAAGRPHAHPGAAGAARVARHRRACSAARSSPRADASTSRESVARDRWRSAIARAPVLLGVAASCSASSSTSRRPSILRRSSILALVSARRGVSSVQQSWSGSSEMASVPSRRASAMISVLSQPSSGRRIGSRTASSSAVMFGSVWLDTWPRESPVTSAGRVQPGGERLGRLEHQPPLRHHLEPPRPGGGQRLLRLAERHHVQPGLRPGTGRARGPARRPCRPTPGPVSGMPEKCRKVQRSPRFIIR